jgi:hypothetical protein
MMIRRSLPGFVLLILSAGFLTAQETDSTSGVDLTYAVGADLSFLKSAEDRGIQFKENGVVRPGLDIFRDHGYDWIRLRLFHTPTRLPNDLEYTIALAQEIRRSSRRPRRGIPPASRSWPTRCTPGRGTPFAPSVRPESCRRWSRSATRSETG